MFTGIIESTGIIEKISEKGSNREFWVRSSISSELKVDQSLAHNGICLTVEAVSEQTHCITAVAETLSVTTAGQWRVGDHLNLERCLQFNGRIDGHFVQGHVDGLATCIEKKNLDGSTEFRFEIEEKFAPLIVEKGSVTINGISLTCFGLDKKRFTIAVIPYTISHTNIDRIEPGTQVNIEFDIIGKYINRAAFLSRR